MSEPEPGYKRFALIIDPDASRAASIGDLVELCGASWTHCAEIGVDIAGDGAVDCDAVFISEEELQQFIQSDTLDLRRFYPGSPVLVGMVRSNAIDSPTLFSAGLDLILYEPLALADIERALGFVEAVRTEDRQQARDRLRKLTALHELAITASHQTGTSGWLDRLIDAGRRILGADALAMWLRDQENQRLRCVGSSGLSPDYIHDAESQSHLLFDHYPELPRNLSTHWLTNNEEPQRFRIIAPSAAERAGIKHIAWMPVRDVRNLHGHISFYFMSDDTFEHYDLVLADAFASIVAAALGTHNLQTEIRRSNRLYREHVESSPDGVVVCLPDGTIERSNPAMAEISGRDRFEFLGKHLVDFFMAPEEVPWHDWANLSPDEPAEPVELWLMRPDGGRRRVACFARRVLLPHAISPDELEERIQIVVEDITVPARRLVELELFHDLTRLISERGSLEEAYELVASRLYNYLNYRMMTVGELVEGPRRTLRAFRADMLGETERIEFDVSRGLCGLAVRENRSLLVRDVSEHPDYLEIDPAVVSEVVSVIRAEGRPVGLIDIQTDASQPLDQGDLQLTESIAAHLGLLIEQMITQERLEQQAMTDPLTGMANRRAFMNEIHALVNCEDSASAGLFLVELDHFKQVNDLHGHLYGDEMLKQVASRLHSVLRERDHLARYGGDEIAIIFRGLDNDGVVEIAERLRRVISDKPFVFNGVSVSLTVSIGIALFPQHGRTTDALIGEADRAMYAAKLEGRNSVYGDFLTSAPSD